jgi:hypothetical protein
LPTLGRPTIPIDRLTNGESSADPRAKVSLRFLVAFPAAPPLVHVM